MEAEMRSMLTVPLLLTLFCHPSTAQEQTDVGRGVICDTAKAVQQFVTLRADGKEVVAALQAINEEQRATTCTVAFVMFSGGKPIAELAVNGKPLTILEITVHAFGDGRAWKQVPQIVQYTAVAEKGVLI